MTTATTYVTLDEALEAARSSESARRELARRGLGHVMVAEVSRGGVGYRLVATTVEPDGSWHTSINRHVVMTTDGRTCPVCGLTGEVTQHWVRPGVASGSFITGLNPSGCAGCHDTLTTYGVAPMEIRGAGTNVSIPRPE